MGQLQTSTGTLGATVSHTGNTKPSSMVGATHGGTSGKSSPRALLPPSPRGWVGKKLHRRNSFSHRGASALGNHRGFTKRRQCAGKKLANYLNSLGLNFPTSHKMEVMLPVLYRAGAVITAQRCLAHRVIYRRGFNNPFLAFPRVSAISGIQKAANGLS